MSFNKNKSHYNHFIKTLKIDELTTHEIKLINLISNNFDSIASVGTAAGKRASLLNELINKNRDWLSQDLSKIEDEAIDSNNYISRINSIEIQNFRGFASKEVFDLNKPKVLVYGPNGSGKTSFCEALEYSLLGYLSEADAKRIDVKQYITNVHTGMSSQPKLTGKNLKRETIDIKSSPSGYYFCFIEKNRIIDFARYSSKTRGQQENLLATLFGLDEFYSFINGFTENISNKIPVESLKQKQLDEKTQELSGHKQNIKSSTKKISELEGQKKFIEEKSKLNKTFDQLDLYINGNQSTKGRIELIDKQLKKPRGRICNYTTTDKLLESILKVEKK